MKSKKYFINKNIVLKDFLIFFTRLIQLITNEKKYV